VQVDDRRIDANAADQLGAVRVPEAEEDHHGREHRDDAEEAMVARLGLEDHSREAPRA
jgi:hypothetical protein